MGLRPGDIVYPKRKVSPRRETTDHSTHSPTLHPSIRKQPRVPSTAPTRRTVSYAPTSSIRRYFPVQRAAPHRPPHQLHRQGDKCAIAEGVGELSHRDSDSSFRLSDKATKLVGDARTVDDNDDEDVSVIKVIIRGREQITKKHTNSSVPTLPVVASGVETSGVTASSLIDFQQMEEIWKDLDYALEVAQEPAATVKILNQGHSGSHQLDNAINHPKKLFQMDNNDADVSTTTDGPVDDQNRSLTVLERLKLLMPEMMVLERAQLSNKKNGEEIQ